MNTVLSAGDTNLRHLAVCDGDRDYWTCYSDEGLVFKPEVVLEEWEGEDGRANKEIVNHSNVHTR
jgi:hypothetical protein